MSHFLQFANCPDSSWLQRSSGNSSYFVVHLNIYQFISNENLRLCNTQSICKTFSTCCCNVNINMQLSSCSMFSLLINTAAVTYCQQTPQAALPLLSSWMKGTFLRTRSYQVAFFFSYKQHLKDQSTRAGRIPPSTTGNWVCRKCRMQNIGPLERSGKSIGIDKNKKREGGRGNKMSPSFCCV